jgi:opacity protein-like surface antigen
MKKTLLLAGVASVFAFNANALDLTPYVGLDYNYSMLDHDEPNYDMRNGTKEGVMAGQAHSASVVLGAKVTPYAGVEAFYQLSKKEHKADYRSQIQAYGADVLGYLPLGCYGEYEVLASAGLGQYTAKYNKDQDSGLGYRLGAGLQYNLTDNWAVRAMYRHVWVDKSILNCVNEVSLGVRYSF